MLAFSSFVFTGREDYNQIQNNNVFDFLFNNEIEVENWLGNMGAAISHFFIYKGFGVSSVVIPFLLFLIGFKMKSYKEMEIDRKRSHRSPDINSVHRTSLMVPELEHSIAEITFLNHFLIKRNYEHVTCCITAIDLDGKRIEKRWK